MHEPGVYTWRKCCSRKQKKKTLSDQFACNQNSTTQNFDIQCVKIRILSGTVFQVLNYAKFSYLRVCPLFIKLCPVNQNFVANFLCKFCFCVIFKRQDKLGGFFLNKKNDNEIKQLLSRVKDSSYQYLLDIRITTLSGKN